MLTENSIEKKNRLNQKIESCRILQQHTRLSEVDSEAIRVIARALTRMRRYAEIHNVPLDTFDEFVTMVSVQAWLEFENMNEEDLFIGMTEDIDGYEKRD